MFSYLLTRVPYVRLLTSSILLLSADLRSASSTCSSSPLISSRCPVLVSLPPAASSSSAPAAAKAPRGAPARATTAVDRSTDAVHRRRRRRQRRAVGTVSSRHGAGGVAPSPRTPGHRSSTAWPSSIEPWHRISPPPVSRSARRSVGVPDPAARCHRPGAASAPSAFDLRRDVALARTWHLAIRYGVTSAVASAADARAVPAMSAPARTGPAGRRSRQPALPARRAALRRSIPPRAR